MFSYNSFDLPLWINANSHLKLVGLFRTSNLKFYTTSIDRKRLLLRRTFEIIFNCFSHLLQKERFSEPMQGLLRCVIILNYIRESNWYLARIWKGNLPDAIYKIRFIATVKVDGSNHFYFFFLFVWSQIKLSCRLWTNIKSGLKFGDLFQQVQYEINLYISKINFLGLDQLHSPVKCFYVYKPMLTFQFGLI